MCMFYNGIKTLSSQFLRFASYGMYCISLMLDQKKDLKNHKFVSSQYASFWSSSSLLYVWIFCCDVLMSLNPRLGFQKKSTIFYEWTFTRYLLNPTHTYLTIRTVYHGIELKKNWQTPSNSWCVSHVLPLNHCPVRRAAATVRAKHHQSARSRRPQVRRTAAMKKIG